MTTRGMLSTNPPGVSIHSVKRTNKAFMNDKGELSCDHEGYVIDSTSDLGYSPTFQLSAFSGMF